uniref:SAP domain-containing protein n=1 Tax=viral metagenome TaxID=1070528 RepID=A0A6C0K2G5_9ZZZZ
MTNAMSKPMIQIDSVENIISKHTKGELAIKSCKLPDLKAVAKYYKLRITGTKPELIERIETHFDKNKKAGVIQAIFRGHLVRFSIKLRGCALKKRSMCVNDSDFYTLDPIDEIECSDFYSYIDKQGFIYGFSVSSLISLFKRKGHITNPYNREKLDFKTMNEIFLLYKLCNILYPSQLPVVEKQVANSVVQVASLPGPASPAGAVSIVSGSPPLSAVGNIAQVLNITPQQNELRERMNVIQSRPTEDRIRELFMEMDQLGNYTNETWFSNLTDRGLVNYFRYLYDIWSYRGQLTRQTKTRISSLQDPFAGMANLQTVELDELRKHCLHVMEHMVYTGIDIEYQRIGTLHVLSALTLVSLPARQAMYWLYEGLVY